MRLRKKGQRAADAVEPDTHDEPVPAESTDDSVATEDDAAEESAPAGAAEVDAVEADADDAAEDDEGTAGQDGEDAGDAGDVKDGVDAEDAEDAGDLEDAEDVDDADDLVDVEGADDVADVEGADDVEDVEEPDGVADAADAEDTDDDEADAPSAQPPVAGVAAAEARNRRPRGAHARRVTPRQRLRALVAPQANKTQALIALACLVLGFGLSVQVQSTSSASSFSSLRQSELVSLLDRLTNRQEHLRREISRLQQEKAALASENGDAARKAAQNRQDTLGILAGTEPAAGPGIELTITDPHTAINAADVLNAVEELRDSGAEVMQIGSVRIGADTYFLDTTGGVIVDGHKLVPPYRVLAIGEPHTMGTAMNIPGGVLESLHRSGAEGAVTESQSLSITAVRKP